MKPSQPKLSLWINQWSKILKHFISTLKHTPLLAAWLLVGPLIALVLDGWTGLLFGMINLVLLGIYAVLIRWMTPSSPDPTPIERPRVELLIGLLLVVLFFITQLLDFDVWMVEPIHDWVRNFFASVYRFIYALDWIPVWAQNDLFLAISSTIKKLIPTLIVFRVLGYRRQAMGFAGLHPKLTAILVGATAVFGLLTGVLLRAPLYQVIGLYLIGIFINALPEELFFRGYLLPRLEKILGNPLNALVLSALLFNMMHIPIQIHNGTSPLDALLGVFSIGYPSGLIWGYLYLRTRSIIPGTLWHAANGNFGFLMMSM